MKKIILIIFFVFVFFIIAFGYFTLFQKNGEIIIPDLKKQSSKSMTKTNIVRLKGVVTDVHNGCWADGICSIKIDDKWWIPIIKGGLRSPNSKPDVRGEVVGIVFNEENESVGKKVEIYAKKADENSLTIFGSKEYYVKVINR